MATEAPPQASCPTCGVRLERTNLSLCAYCGSPLQLGAKQAPPDDELAKRLGRLSEHAEFRARLAWTPIDPVGEAPVAGLRAGAWVALAAGAACAVVALAGGAPAGALAWIGYALAAAGAGGLAAARAWRSALRHGPMLRRAAIVLDRRSETDSDRGATTYFFRLRFHDGSEGEFRFPGRGTQYDPMANGAAGIAFTRGERLVEFHRITG